jgi:hypothetical protein
MLTDQEGQKQKDLEAIEQKVQDYLEELLTEAAEKWDQPTFREAVALFAPIYARIQEYRDELLCRIGH